MSNEKLDRRLVRLRMNITRDPVLMELGPVMRLGTYALSDTTPTAYTDGVNEVYGREFMEALEDPPATFVLVHETMHKVCRHIVTYAKLWEKNPRLANMATDYWINLKLDKIAKTTTKATMSMPVYTQKLLDMFKPGDAGLGDKFGLLDYKYEGMTVPEIFRALEQEQEQRGKGGKGSGDGDPSDYGGFDSHDWEKGNGIPKEAQERIRQDIERALREGKAIAKQHGAGSSGLGLGLDELLVPKVDWRQLMRQFVQATCNVKSESSFTRLNRRYMSMGLSMPVLRGGALRKLGVGVDASGSMFCGTPTAFQLVMSEFDGLVKQLGIEELHLMYWDGEVCQHEVYTPQTVGHWSRVTQPKGGGGTDPACVPKYLRDKQLKLDAAVMLTDGAVPGWGQWECPVLWCITDKKITAGVGKTIHVDREEV